MSIALAIADLTITIEGLTWVPAVYETERDPGTGYTVQLLQGPNEIQRNTYQIKSHVYGLLIRLTISGTKATTTMMLTRQKELEDAIEADPHRDNNAQTTYFGEGWESVDTENGLMSAEAVVFMQIQN